MISIFLLPFFIVCLIVFDYFQYWFCFLLSTYIVCFIHVKLAEALVGWLVGCVLRPIDSEVIKRRHSHLLSLVKDTKLGKYTVPTRNQTPGGRVAFHYTTAAPRQLQCSRPNCE